MPLLICLNRSGRLIPAIDTTAGSLLPLSAFGFLLSGISTEHFVDSNKPLLLAKTLEPVFFQFKGLCPLNFKKSSQRANNEAVHADWHYFLPALVFAGQPP
jgi:hypothetical protein